MPGARYPVTYTPSIASMAASRWWRGNANAGSVDEGQCKREQLAKLLGGDVTRDASKALLVQRPSADCKGKQNSTFGTAATHTATHPLLKVERELSPQLFQRPQHKLHTVRVHTAFKSRAFAVPDDETHDANPNRAGGLSVVAGDGLRFDVVAL